MKHPAEMLLKVLLNGGTVQDKDYQYVMDEEGHLCVVMINGDEESLYRIETDISAFIKMAERIGRDELWLKCCEIELQKMKQKKR